MKKMTMEEMKEIKGGFSVWAGLGIAAIIVFLTGVIDGFVHPNSCGGEN